MKTLIENIIKRKNPAFEFDKAVTRAVLIGLAKEKGKSLFRGLRMLRYGRWIPNLTLGRGVRFFNASNISFGKWVNLDDFVYISALGKGKVSLGNNVSIGAFSRVVLSTSFNNIGEHIIIGNNVGIGEFAYLGGGGGLKIGDDCIIGQYLSCHPENHIYCDTETLIRHQGVERKGIEIGSNCWIGSKVTILDGVTIGANCVIAAGAVVTKCMPANSVIGGVPARVLKSTIQENLEIA